jgi:hypothetical protein
MSNDIFEIRGATIAEVSTIEPPEGGYNTIELSMEDGRRVRFNSMDASQDSTSCHWHIHPIEVKITK